MKLYKTFMILIVLASPLIGINSYANTKSIVCEGVTSSSGQTARVEIKGHTVIVSGGLLRKPHVFNSLTEVNGLITAPGLAIHMQNAYGCLRFATIISEFQEPFGAGYMEVLNVPVCSGGSTPDDVCGIK
jgi:hypothetical protein